MSLIEAVAPTRWGFSGVGATCGVLVAIDGKESLFARRERVNLDGRAISRVNAGMQRIRSLNASALAMVASLALGATGAAQDNFPGARSEVYKTVDDVGLRMHIFEPEGHTEDDARPAIVFFFGGGWRTGDPAQFEPHCRYLASRGMVAMTADYRVSSRHGAKAVDCVEDGKSAIRWIRANAGRLGVDPARIAAGGGSAGGHVAASAGVISDFDAAGESKEVSSKPDALALFNPAVVLAPVDGKPTDFDGPKTAEEMRERMGVKLELLSPYHHVDEAAPPTLILHGEADTAVPYKSVVWYQEKAQNAGARCELVGYPEQPHGFFNYGRGGNTSFIHTLTQLDEFLASLDYLGGEPQVEAFVASYGRATSEN